MFKKLLALIVIVFCLSCKANDMETVRVVLPYGMGGGPDRVFRILQNYGIKKNINFVPEYKPGAQGLIGMQYALTQENTLMLCIVSDLINLHNSNKLDINNYTGIGAISMAEVQIAVRADLKVENLRDLLSQLKQNPQQYTWAVSSSSMQNQVEWIGKQLGLNPGDLFVVNFQTVPQGVNAVASGNVDIVASPTSALIPMYEAKKIKRLGLIKVFGTSQEESLEDIFHKQISPDGFGMFMSGNHSARANYWSKFIHEFISDPQVKEQFNQVFFPVFDNSRQGLNRILQHRLDKISAPQSLTFRQEQIARLIKTRGLTIKQIAQTLAISEATVKLHTGIVMKKFGVQNKNQLIVAMNNFG